MSHNLKVILRSTILSLLVAFAASVQAASEPMDSDPAMTIVLPAAATTTIMTWDIITATERASTLYRTEW